MFIGRHSWYDCCPCSKWTRVQTLDKAVYVSHSANTPEKKGWIQYFTPAPKLWVNNWAYWVLKPWSDNQSRRETTQNSHLLNSAKETDHVSCPALWWRGLVDTRLLTWFTEQNSNNKLRMSLNFYFETWYENPSQILFEGRRWRVSIHKSSHISM